MSNKNIDIITTGIISFLIAVIFNVTAVDEFNIEPGSILEFVVCVLISSVVTFITWKYWKYKKLV